MEPIQFDSGESSQEPQGDPASSLLVPMVRSRWLIAGAVLVGALGGIAYGIVKPNSYLSYGKLLVRFGTREEVTPEVLTGGAGNAGLGQSRSLVNNEIEVLAVPQVFEAVAREVTPPRIFSSYDPRAADTEETPLPLAFFHRFQAWWFRRATSEQSGKVGHVIDDCQRCVTEAAHTLFLDMTLRAELDSSVITAAYIAQDPELARQIVNAFLTAAEARHRESYNTNSTLEFVSERLQEALAEREAAEREFNDYRLSCKVYDYESQRTQLMTEIQTLETEAATGASLLASLKSRGTVLTNLLAEIPATTDQEVERPPIPDQRWAQLQQRVFQLEDALNAVERRVGGTTAEREAERTMVLQRLEATKAELKAQDAWVIQTPVLQPVANPRHQRLTQELDTLNQEIAAQESKTDKLVERLQAANTKLISTEQCEPRYHFLEATTRNAQDKYNAFVKAHERTNLANLLDQVDFSNLRRIQDATLPYEKEGPKRGKFLLVGIILGGLLGSVLAFLRHQLDPFVRSPNDVEQLLGVKVVGVTPKSRLPWRLRRAIRRAIRSAAL